MGMFSWKDAITGESIANVDAGQPEWQSKCYLITPDSVYYESAYEGYGVFGSVDIYELLGDGDRDKGIDESLKGKGKFKIKLVLEKNYNGQTYGELRESEDCEYQGFFY